MAAITCSLVPHGQGEQALFRQFGDLGHRHDQLLRHGNLARLPLRLGTAAVLLGGVAHGAPLPSSDDLAVARHLPLGRPQTGTVTLKFYEGRDILRAWVNRLLQECAS